MIYLLDERMWFPPAEAADEEGMLAVGGDLSSERLLVAYKAGIFPWFSGDMPMWWCPDPRFVLYPEELKVSKSMQALLKRNVFQFRVNSDFGQVIANCRQKERPGQDGTWITTEVQNAYMRMHELGYAHSAEAWKDGKLVGGLYGMRLGRVFFGESMFSHESNASKYAFIKYVQQLMEEGVELIDCQVYTEHLESLGAKMIGRKLFLDQIKNLIGE
ncbi:MAG TPA: leucyl/phenylalanyl-tRNA--protein transferase [Flavipsychrobacter sp.]|nr:leucyl/phenylalanyl-tRNA--protein transferase [Flavipsychrobacter sp.]